MQSHTRVDKSLYLKVQNTANHITLSSVIWLILHLVTEKLNQKHYEQND